jgi:hypothetical protein
MAGGSFSKRFRKLALVEEIIERHFGFSGVLLFESCVERIESPGLRVFFHLAIPSLGIALLHFP